MNINPEDIEPLGSLVLIRVSHERETQGGIVIPETSRLYGKNVAEVIAVGPGDMLKDAETGACHFRKADLEPGDFVLLRYNSEQAEIRIADDFVNEYVCLVDPSVCLAKLKNWKRGQVAA